MHTSKGRPVRRFRYGASAGTGILILTSVDWTSQATTEALLESYSDFAPSILACLKKAEDVKCWQLLQRHSIPSWVNGRFVLVGDAAHPMLPRKWSLSVRVLPLISPKTKPKVAPSLSKMASPSARFSDLAQHQVKFPKYLSYISNAGIRGHQQLCKCREIKRQGRGLSVVGQILHLSPAHQANTSKLKLAMTSCTDMMLHHMQDTHGSQLSSYDIS